MLFIAIVHIVMIGLSFFIFTENKIYFILSEVFILISIFIFWQLYHDFIAPMQLLMTGIDAIRDQDFNVKFLKTGKLEMDELIEVYNLMIDRLRDERVLQEQQHYFLEKLIQTSPTGILILDFDHNISNANAKSLEILGCSADQLKSGKKNHPLFSTIESLHTGESKTIHINNQVFKCQKSHFMDRGFKHYFVMIEELTREIMIAEKKAYGKVIRMMAHEVNNSIGAIHSILDTTASTQKNSPEIQHALHIAMDRNQRLNQFMKNFASVVRLPDPAKQMTDLNTLVENITQLIQYQANPSHAVIQKDLSSVPVPVSIDKSQIEQVLINILKNSIESIEHKSALEKEYQGEIKIITRALAPQLTIADNGIGIAPENQDYIFTPFYTNKREGQGIGLTLVRDILNNHGFKFSLTTDISGWTLFTIWM